MNSESLGHYSFGQSTPDRRSKTAKLEGAKSLASGEGRCVKGVCEVAWKPTQQNSFAQQDKPELMARGD
jgi:hypothetical protein